MERTPVPGGYLIEMSPEEIAALNKSTKTSMELAIHAQEVAFKHDASTEPISETERQIGGVVHAVINENLSIEEAEARIKLINDNTAPSRKK